MIHRTLSYDELGITPAEIYTQMGYGDATPDIATIDETSAMLAEAKTLTHPSFCFFITDGELDTENYVLSAMGHSFNIGKIISSQLRRSERYAFFVATAGENFEQLRKATEESGDMVKAYIADSIGSVIAEKTADRMEDALNSLLAQVEWNHTNRFSPGYCGWHVSAQHDLFALFPDGKPCGVTLTPSALMIPIKSVSGVIGLGKNVRHLDYTCGLCDYKLCYKRQKSLNKSREQRI